MLRCLTSPRRIKGAATTPFLPFPPPPFLFTTSFRQLTRSLLAILRRLPLNASDAGLRHWHVSSAARYYKTINIARITSCNREASNITVFAPFAANCASAHIRIFLAIFIPRIPEIHCEEILPVYLSGYSLISYEQTRVFAVGCRFDIFTDATRPQAVVSSICLFSFVSSLPNSRTLVPPVFVFETGNARPDFCGTGYFIKLLSRAVCGIDCA